MIELTPLKQNTDYSCGPISLKMVLNKYGVKKSEKELIKLCKARSGYGCDPDDIVRAAKEVGCKAMCKQDSSLNELRKFCREDIPVIVDWFSPEVCGHYSVVVGIDEKDICLADPYLGKIRKMDVNEFENRWFELDNYPPKNRCKFALREIVIVKKE